MGDSSAEVSQVYDVCMDCTPEAAKHDYMSVIEQLVMASSQADDAKDALRASAGLFMMED